MLGQNFYVEAMPFQLYSVIHDTSEGNLLVSVLTSREEAEEVCKHCNQDEIECFINPDEPFNFPPKYFDWRWRSVDLDADLFVGMASGEDAYLLHPFVVSPVNGDDGDWGVWVLEEWVRVVSSIAFFSNSTEAMDWVERFLSGKNPLRSSCFGGMRA